jgi:hypothetical protein
MSHSCPSPGVLPMMLLLLVGCGHVVYHAPNHPEGDFDFACPPCSPATGEEAEGMVTVRYLGAGGLYLGWQGEAVMTSPFFSNYSLLRVGAGRFGASREAIEAGLAGVPVGRVRAILAGHSHYDHLGDLPVVAEEHAREARIYVNRAGFNLLAPYGFGERLCSLEDHLGEWVWVTGPDGGRRPIRFLAVRSSHAPHIFGYLWRGGEVKEPLKKKWDGGPVGRLRAGATLAFVIDLMSPDFQEVRYRIYYQDSASPAWQGEPPEIVMADGRPFDLAVLCMASYNRVADCPGTLLGTLKPRHVLVTHYENFFQPRNEPVRFVSLLTNRLANEYLARVEESLRRGGPVPQGPVNPVCGPSGPEWTMPLPGETLQFRPVPPAGTATASAER